MTEATKRQTRQEDFDDCKANGLPLPEIITPTTVTHTNADGSKVLAKDADHNHNDFREWDETLKQWGPWQRA